MWRAKDCDPEQIKWLRAVRERFDLRPLAVHVNYLVNLATNAGEIRARSIACFRGELERAAAIGAEYLVLHPGSYRGQSIEESTVNFATALREAVEPITHSAQAKGVTILIENTAGAGAHLGSRFEELRTIRDLAREVTEIPVGFCLDTCHLLAAGYDIAQPAGLRATLRSAEEWLGLANVHLIHANDSRGAARLARGPARQYRRRPHRHGRIPADFAFPAAHETLPVGNPGERSGRRPSESRHSETPGRAAPHNGTAPVNKTAARARRRPDTTDPRFKARHDGRNKQSETSPKKDQ